MSSRVTGAGLALIAVALLAVSIATPAVLPAQLSLFAGHPTVADHTRGTQDVYVGFYSAELCNSGGDGTCKSGDATSGFRIFGYAELGLTGLLLVISVALALLTLSRSEGRKSAAVLGWIVGILAIGGAGALIVQGPFHGASVPIGVGMVLHGIGIVGAMLAGVIAVRPPRPIRLRVGNPGAKPSALPAAQAFDRRPLHEQPRPGELGSEPRFGYDARTRPAPAALDDDPAPDPFAPPIPVEGPMLSSGPQLRPLYDAAPIQGGTGGLLPIERPVMPMRPPTPVPRAAISSVTGMPTPPPFPAEQPHPGPRPVPADEARPRPRPFSADEQRPRPMPPDAPPPARPVGFEPPPARSFILDEPAPARPHVFEDEPSPVWPYSRDERPPPSLPTEEPRPVPQSFSIEVPRPVPPPHPVGRAKPPSIAPPLPVSGPPPPPAPPFTSAGQAGSNPRTQVSLVPPMPDNDLPNGPPAAQMAGDGNPEPLASAPGTEPTLFPRPETPLAPPPSPVAPAPRAHRDSEAPTHIGPPLPRAHRDSEAPTHIGPPLSRAHRDSEAPTHIGPPLPRTPREGEAPTQIGPPLPRAHRDSEAPTQIGAPLPRAQRDGVSSPIDPPLPRAQRDGQVPPPVSGTESPRSPLRAAVPMPARPVRSAPISTSPPFTTPLRGSAPRPTISTSVPPIPAIPPVPAPLRAETDPQDPAGSGDIDQATVSRVPIEVGDYDSQTYVSVGIPSSEDINAAVDGRTASGLHDAGQTIEQGADGDPPGSRESLRDTSPNGEPIAIGHAAAAAAEPDAMAISAALAAARPTIQMFEQRPSHVMPVVIAPPISPQLRDRSMPKLPITTAPDSLPPPRDSKQASGPSPACPQCESPMAWVEEHLRFYCKSCRMYF